MRIFLHQNAIIESARLAFIGIHAEIDRAGMSLRYESPLNAGREASTSPATQTGILDKLHHLFWRHFKRVSQSLITAPRLIYFEVLDAWYANIAQ
jgi:hypothetical protein